MFAVLDMETGPPVGSLTRWAQRGQDGGCRLARHERPDCWRVTLLRPMDAPERELFRRARAAFELIVQTGSVGVVLPRGFPYPFLAEEYRLPVSHALPLYRRLAGRLALAAAAERGTDVRSGLHVALLGRRVTAPLQAAASYLLGHVRRLTVQAGAAGELLCRRLLAPDGVRLSPVLDDDADVYVLFSDDGRPLCVPLEAPVLDFTGGTPHIFGGVVATGAELQPPRSLWGLWTEGSDTPALLAALVASGQVHVDDIGIRRLTYRPPEA